MKINQAGLELIKSFEKLRLEAYPDEGGVWTIGYGHTKDVQEGDRLTPWQAEDLLKEDVAQFEEGVTDLLERKVTSNQFSALVSFAYNVGVGALQRSKLLSLVNLGDFKAAAGEFDKWDHDNGKVVLGLTRRREAEKKLFLTEDA